MFLSVNNQSMCRFNEVETISQVPSLNLFLTLARLLRRSSYQWQNRIMCRYSGYPEQIFFASIAHFIVCKIGKINAKKPSLNSLLGVASSLRRIKSKSPDLCKRRRLLLTRRRLEPTPSRFGAREIASTSWKYEKLIGTRNDELKIRLFYKYFQVIFSSLHKPNFNWTIAVRVAWILYRVHLDALS